MKYAHLESERKLLVRSIPPGHTHVSAVVDRYVDGTRLRLRTMTAEDGSVVRKLGQKVRVEGPQRLAHTTLYLDDAEWDALASLPATELLKTRYHYQGGVVVDQLPDGSLLAEVDGGTVRLE